jgi:hypothetical protein
MTTAEIPNVAKAKKGRPKGSGRDYIAVKVDRAMVGMAKMIATREGVSVAELLSELLEGPIERRYVQMIRQIEEKTKQ